MQTAQKTVLAEVMENMTEHADHIASNEGSIAHQREHFDMLSADMHALIKTFPVSNNVFVDHCPMFNKKKGAIWLSEIKEIKNPYYGKEMLECGNIKEEIKAQ